MIKLVNNEWGLVITNNESVHYYLVKQGYFQMKYKFIKSFHLLINKLSNVEINYILIYLIFNVVCNIIDNFIIFNL